MENSRKPSTGNVSMIRQEGKALLYGWFAARQQLVVSSIKFWWIWWCWRPQFFHPPTSFILADLLCKAASLPMFWAAINPAKFCYKIASTLHITLTNTRQQFMPVGTLLDSSCTITFLYHSSHSCWMYDVYHKYHPTRAQDKDTGLSMKVYSKNH